MTGDQKCPCGSGIFYSDCCEPLHSGAKSAQSTADLLRARYSAFVLKRAEYIRATWMEGYLPEELTLDGVRWLGLEILEWQGACDDCKGRALYHLDFESQGERRRLLCESLYERIDGEWFYREERRQREVALVKVGRNVPCPCGSGRKFKRCCGRE